MCVCGGRGLGGGWHGSGARVMDLVFVFVCVAQALFQPTLEKGFFWANFLYTVYFWSHFHEQRVLLTGKAETEVGADGQGRHGAGGR